MACCRLGERGGTCLTAVFERPDLRDELCDLARAACGFRVRSAWAALAGGRVGEAATAGRPQHSAADAVCVDRRPGRRRHHRSRLARELTGRWPRVIAPWWPTRRRGVADRGNHDTHTRTPLRFHRGAWTSRHETRLRFVPSRIGRAAPAAESLDLTQPARYNAVTTTPTPATASSGRSPGESCATPTE